MKASASSRSAAFIREPSFGTASPPFNEEVCKTHVIPQQPITTYPETANIIYHRIHLINC